MKTGERQAAVLKALGRVESFSAEIGLLKSTLETVLMWRPAAGLVRQCDEAIRIIAGITARFDRSLVVTVIGPSGSGKSTLVNALAGGMSCQRPAPGDRPPTSLSYSEAAVRTRRSSPGNSATIQWTRRLLRRAISRKAYV